MDLCNAGMSSNNGSLCVHFAPIAHGGPDSGATS